MCTGSHVQYLVLTFYLDIYFGPDFFHISLENMSDYRKNVGAEWANIVGF